MKIPSTIYDNPTEKEKQFFLHLIHNLSLHTKEQLSALCGDIPMTIELFEEILGICIDTDDIDGFFALCDDYPQLFQEHYKQMQEELEVMKLPTS